MARVEQDLTQRMILATWLVEFYLSKCNELDDMIASRLISQDVENLQAERTILEEEIRHFFVTYKAWNRLLRLVGSRPDVPLQRQTSILQLCMNSSKDTVERTYFCFMLRLLVISNESWSIGSSRKSGARQSMSLTAR